MSHMVGFDFQQADGSLQVYYATFHGELLAGSN